MKLTKWGGFIITLFTSTLLYGQLTDIARIDFTILPKGNSTFEYIRTRALFNYPMKLKEKESYFILGLDYSNINLNVDDIPKNIRSEVREFQILDLNIGYTSLIKNDWRFGIILTPGVSSNLTAKDLTFEDIVLSGAIVFIKEKNNFNTNKKAFKLLIGVSYSGNRGFPYPLPFVSYYKKFHANWSYALGIPKTNFQYHFTEEHKLKFYAGLDGFTTNIQQGFLVDDTTEVAESINMSLIASGLRYEYHFSDHLQLFADASRVLNQRIGLRNENRKNIKSLNNANQFYLSAGFRFKI